MTVFTLQRDIVKELCSQHKATCCLVISHFNSEDQHCDDHFRIQIMIKTFFSLVHPLTPIQPIYTTFCAHSKQLIWQEKEKNQLSSLEFCMCFVFNAHTTIQFLDHCHLAFFFNLYRIDWGNCE